MIVSEAGGVNGRQRKEHHMQHNIKPLMTAARRLLRMQQVEERTGLKRSAIYQLVASGSFPRQVRLGDGKCPPVAWVEAEIEQWIENRIAARDSA